MRHIKSAGSLMGLLFILIAMSTLPAGAAVTLTATPSSVTLCNTLPQTVTVSASGGTLGTLTATSSDSHWAAEVTAANQVAIILQIGVTTTLTGTVTITDTTNNVSVVVSVTAQAGGTCGGGGGGTGTVTASPNPINLTAPQGSYASTNLALSSPTATTWTITPNPGNCASGWLSVSPSAITSPVTSQNIVVFATTGGLVTGQVCSGSLTVVAGSTTLTVGVNLTVGTGTGTTGLASSPSSFSFTGSQTLTLSVTDPSATTFTAYVNTQSGGQWLTINNNYSAGGTLPTNLNVTVNAANLTSGQTYSGTILITSSPDNQTLQVPVSVTPGGTGTNPALQITPASVSLSSPAGSTNLVTQTLSITSNTGGLTYTATVSTSTGGQWLIVAPGSGTIPATNVSVYANPAGLSAGTYYGTINFSTQGSVVVSQAVPVTFVVGGGVTGQVAPTSLSFAYQSGISTAVPTQTVLVNGVVGSSYSTSITYNSGSNWLSVSPPTGTITSNAPANLTVSITNLALPGGTYSATLTVTTTTATQSIPVNLTVTTAPVLTSNPGSFYFQAQAGGGSPGAQNLILNTSSGVALSYTLTVSNSWITVTTPSSLTTPSYLAVQVNPQSLPSGLNVGTITVAAAGAGNTPLVIPVVVAVVGGVTVTPTALSFSALTGGASPGSQVLSVSASTATAFVASASGGSWLSVSPTTATTPSYVTVTVNSTGLASGVYNGTVAISAGGTTQNIPVVLTVSTSGGTGGNITLSPSTLSFTAQAGGQSPGVQGIQVSSSTIGVGFSAAATTSSGGNWLSVSPTSGAAPVNLGVSVNPASLAGGTYQGTITVTPVGGTAQTVSVTLTVQGQATLTASPTTLAFTYRTGDSAPAAQTISVTSTGAALAFTASATTSGGGSWLSVTPASGTTPGSLSASVNPSGVSPGSYTGTITITNTSTGTTLTVSVALSVTGPLPTISKVVNAASYTGSAVSPGEIVTLFGDSIGPSAQATLTLDANGKVSTTLGNVQVLFNGVPAPVTFVSSSQVNAVVPYEIAGRLTTSVWIRYQGVTSNVLTLPVATTAPGIFTLNATGTGPGAILNQDNSLNSSGNPAPQGSIVVLYATGEGQTIPTGVTGSVTTPPNLPTPILPVAVLIDGQPATVLYAGEAPGLVAGVMQVNVRVPAGISSGQVSVIVSVGNNSSQNGVTLSVR